MVLTAVALLAAADLVLRVLPGLLSPPVGALLFHQVGPPLRRNDFWSLPLDRFTALLDGLVARGYRSCTLAEIDDLVHRGRRPPGRRRVLLTFDDGCRSHLDAVVPALTSRGLRGVFFVTLEPAAPAPAHLGPTELAGLRAGGEVALHAWVHRSLLRGPAEPPAAWTSRMAHEVTGARERLSTLVGAPVTAMAYPCGECDAGVVGAAAGAGLTLGFTTEYGTIDESTDPYRIPRFMVTRDVPDEDIVEFLEGEWPWWWATAAAEALMVVLCLVSVRRWLRPDARP